MFFISDNESTMNRLTFHLNGFEAHLYNRYQFIVFDESRLYAGQKGNIYQRSILAMNYHFSFMQDNEVGIFSKDGSYLIHYLPYFTVYKMHPCVRCTLDSMFEF